AVDVLIAPLDGDVVPLVRTNVGDIEEDVRARDPLLRIEMLDERVVGIGSVRARRARVRPWNEALARGGAAAIASARELGEGLVVVEAHDAKLPERVLEDEELGSFGAFEHLGRRLHILDDLRASDEAAEDGIVAVEVELHPEAQAAVV